MDRTPEELEDEELEDAYLDEYLDACVRAFDLFIKRLRKRKEVKGLDFIYNVHAITPNVDVESNGVRVCNIIYNFDEEPAGDISFECDTNLLPDFYCQLEDPRTLDIIAKTTELLFSELKRAENIAKLKDLLEE